MFIITLIARPNTSNHNPQVVEHQQNAEVRLVRHQNRHNPQRRPLSGRLRLETSEWKGLGIPGHPDRQLQYVGAMEIGEGNCGLGGGIKNLLLIFSNIFTYLLALKYYICK